MTTTILTHDRVTWTDIIHPDEQDIAALSTRYPQFHPLNLRDCLTEMEFPKLDHYDDYVYLVVHIPTWEETERIPRRTEVDIFVTRGVLVTSHHDELPALQEMFHAAMHDSAAQARLMGQGASTLMYRLLDRLFATYNPLLLQMNQGIWHIEKHLFQDNTRHILTEIALTRRSVIALRHILRPQIGVIESLVRGQWPFIRPELDLYWADIGDHLQQMKAMLDEQFEVINGLSDTIDTVAAHHIDEVVRLLTIITLLTVPLTVLATIFGMNVRMPYSTHPYPFFVVNGIGVLLTVGVIWYLRYRRWL